MSALAILGVLLLSSPRAEFGGQAPVVLESSTLSVAVDPSFPRIEKYTLKQGGASIDGQAEAASSVVLDGRPVACMVAFNRVSPAVANYVLTFPSQQITATLQVTVATEDVEMRLTSVDERASYKLHTLAFPNNALLAVHASQPDCALATVTSYVSGNVSKGVYGEYIGPVANAPNGAGSGNYLFLSEGGIAAGIGDNSIYDFKRANFRIFESGGEKQCSAWGPEFQYREIDTETLEAPYVKVFITGDRNGDGKADWQDAAIAYRDVMPHPLGHEFLGKTVGDQIAMDYASAAQQPFLRILDEVKKTYLATDGIGQEVLIKGYTGEGHDSANSDMYGHFNQRAGGEQDLNFLIQHAHDYNCRIGVHVNVSEVYPEARRYNPAILRYDPSGRPLVGWNWLDVSNLIDKRKDILSGGLYAELDGMRKAMPDLDFLYVDTYWENGWVAYKLASKVNSLGLPLYTEGAQALDPWTAWAHINQLNSRIFRFLWYADRDLFPDDPLLRTDKRVSFMGWDGAGDFNAFIRNLFSRNLPARYLQNFPIMRWIPDEEADLQGGIKVVKAGDTVTVTKDGRVEMEWAPNGTRCRLFVPWDAKSESKVYAWDEVGGERAWKVPSGWAQAGTAFLYRLTDQGKTDETKVPIAGGSVTLNLEKNTPYVLYPAEAPATPPIAWGAGSLVRDPGFDSHSLADWTPSAGAGQMREEDDGLGNSRLVIRGDGSAAGVTQRIEGLTPGKTYSASVWIQVHGERTATIGVTPADPGGAEITNWISGPPIRHKYLYDPRSGTNYQRVKVEFDASSSAAVLALRASQGPAASWVEFDDVRVVEVGKSKEAAKHWFYEDFEHIDEGFGPFACCNVDHTHLSESNPPYTKDVIDGKYSLKSRDKGRILRTIPSSLRFKPNTRYHLTVQTLADPDVAARFTVETIGRVIAEQPIPDGRGQVTIDFTTGEDGNTFLAVYKETRHPGDMLVIDDLAIDENGPGSAAKPALQADRDAIPGAATLLDSTFVGTIPADWKLTASSAPGVKVDALADATRIASPANASTFFEHALPPGTTAVEAKIGCGGDGALSWGAGISLLWPGGEAVRINLRNPESDFGVDSSAGPQVRGGNSDADTFVVLRLRFEDSQIVAEARTDWGEWQQIATLPRDKFNGAPDRIRIGKMAGAGAASDYADLGPLGECLVYRVRAFGKAP